MIVNEVNAHFVCVACVSGIAQPFLQWGSDALNTCYFLSKMLLLCWRQCSLWRSTSSVFLWNSWWKHFISSALHFLIVHGRSRSLVPVVQIGKETHRKVKLLFHPLETNWLQAWEWTGKGRSATWKAIGIICLSVCYTSLCLLRVICHEQQWWISRRVACWRTRKVLWWFEIFLKCKFTFTQFFVWFKKIFKAI